MKINVQVFAKAIRKATWYREVVDGFITRSLTIIRLKDEYLVTTWARHTQLTAHLYFATQKEVSEFTADYFGL